ncbi:hypothetical protein BVRB_8g196650 [Beta vulgaris subsp. vulgaris]|nr:hypothetical protein BVRB_8g196650 [Beta vulgaris subsp. vulgaris]
MFLLGDILVLLITHTYSILHNGHKRSEACFGSSLVCIFMKGVE